MPLDFNRIPRQLTDIIKNVHLSHRFAKQIEHGISFEHSNWKLFEPSKFVYSFFTFNTLYEINWAETIRSERIWDNRRLDTVDKIKKFLQFIYQYKKTITLKEKYDENLSTDFLNRITNDSNIKRIDKSLPVQKTIRQNFEDAIHNYCNPNFVLDQTEHYKIIWFIYQVRNNIFHGSKTATEMIKGGQRERLLIYSNLILATNEMFFSVINENFGVPLSDGNELKENAQLNDTTIIRSN